MANDQDKDFFVKIMAETTNVENGNNKETTDGTKTTAVSGNASKIIKPYDKYDKKHVQELRNSQTDPGLLQNNVTNFKQDYVVAIRKKLFYAATAQNAVDPQTGKEIPNSGDENYLRVYQVNNFINIHTSHNVYGKRPGNCSITIRGGERVICAEKNQEKDQRWEDWQELLLGWTNVDEEAVDTSGTKVFNSDTSSNPVAKNVAEHFVKAGTKWTVGNATWALGEAASGTDFKNLLKAREAKYGWRFAEKCDWEPMDEIYIFAKSRTERWDDKWVEITDKSGNVTGRQKIPGKGAFKMNQIFFGYIDSVEKTYQSDKGGLLMRITATDHLKLLEISRIVNSANMMQGKITGGGLQIDWDQSQFGMFVINEPWKRVADGTATPTQNQQALNIVGNVFTGWYPYEILKEVSTRAGIPKKYLEKRIEDIKTIPFVPQIKSGSNGDLGNAEMKTKLQVCTEVAEKMFLEFYADEEGNIVFKIPNYAVGVNRKIANSLNNPNLEWKSSRLDNVFGAFRVIDLYNQDGKKYLKTINSEDIYVEVLTQPLSPNDVESLKKENEENKKNLKDAQTAYDKAKEDKTTSADNLKAKEQAVYNAQKKEAISTDRLEQHNKLKAASNKDTSEKKENQENKGTSTTEYTVEKNDTLWDIAIKYFGDGTKYGKIKIDNGLTSDDIYPGQVLKIIVGNNDTNKTEEQNKAAMTQPQNQKVMVRTSSGTTISELTDAYIPIIEDKYVISFTLIDTDREIFNMFEINLEAAYNALEGSVATAIRRAVPDIYSILQFGMRPHPGVINTPYISNPVDAEIFGLMMIARSLAGRYSGSLTCIEDSAIKVGDPIRMHMYDETPMKPTGKFNDPTIAGKPASMQEIPQAVFYVVGIERSIDIKGYSTMTLQLKAGRMMGQESIFDISLPLYKFFYEDKFVLDVTGNLQSYNQYFKSRCHKYYPSQNDTIDKIINSYAADGTTLTPALKEKIALAILSLNTDVFGYGLTLADLQAKDNILGEVAKKKGTILLPDASSLSGGDAQLSKGINNGTQTIEDKNQSKSAMTTNGEAEK
jgi:LysM repeat protein